jgi:glucokinase
MSEVYGSIDLGGTYIKCAFGDAEGQLLHTETTPTDSHTGPEGVLGRMAALVRMIEAETDLKPLALGIGIPGLVNLREGSTRFLPNFPTQWRDVPVREILVPSLECPVYLLNDVRTATLGELTFGHGSDNCTMAFFSIGTGIGGGVVVDGKLRLGSLGAAGELGHYTILPDGPLCGCGNRGCLETLASGPALCAAGVRLVRSGLAPILHEIAGGDLTLVTPRTMAEAAAGGDKRVEEEILRAAHFLGIGVANVVTTLYPDLVVLGGGVVQIGDLLLKTVRETVEERIGMFPVDEIEIKLSRLGNNAGILGGIALAMKRGLLDD